MSNAFNKLFQKFESYIARKNNFPYILHSKIKILYIDIYTYKGKEILLKDGSIIKKGDTIGELHIDNIKIKNIDNKFDIVSSLLLDELQNIKNALINGEYDGLKAVYGVTLLHPIAKRFGFTIVNINMSPKKIFLILWDNILRVAFRKNKLKSSNKFREPKQCWLSRGQILKM
ncbi:MAG: hypothetical protein Q8900_00900 [Bacillota bacterium]|nr:hypothetical protein [Bacillota bacterium]